MMRFLFAELVPVNFRLFLRSLQDALLDGSFADQPVNRDLLRLTKPVRSVHCLLVDGGIPVAVKCFGINQIYRVTIQVVTPSR